MGHPVLAGQADDADRRGADGAAGLSKLIKDIVFVTRRRA